MGGFRLAFSVVSFCNFSGGLVISIVWVATSIEENQNSIGRIENTGAEDEGLGVCLPSTHEVLA